MGQPLGGESHHAGQPTRKWRPQSYNHRELNSDKSLNDLRRGPQVSDEK